MDISNNFHDITEAIYEYQRNIRYYTDNIHEYNQNIRTYINMINTSDSRDYMNYRPSITPINNIFRNIGQRRDQRNMFRQNFQDVVVRPTEAQIIRALETYTYPTSEENYTCPITLETIQEGDEVCRIRHCGHIFKRSVIEGWFLRNVRCPVCRYDIRDYVMDTSGIRDISSNPAILSQNDDSMELDDLVEEGIHLMNQTPLANLFRRTPIANTMTNAIRTFINDELQRMPVNDTTIDLLYSFDIPLTMDVSGNYRL